MILEIPESYINEQIGDRIPWAMEKFNMTREQAILYLWGFNEFSTCPAELEDSGRPMYRNLAQVLSRLVKDEAIMQKKLDIALEALNELKDGHVQGPADGIKLWARVIAENAIMAIENIKE